LLHRNLKLKIMTEFIYLILAFINLPFMIQKKNSFRVLSGVAFGFNIALFLCSIIDKF